MVRRAKALVLCSTLAVGGLLLSGCTSGEAPDRGTTTITQWGLTLSEAGKAQLDELTSEFESANPDINIEFVEKGTDQIKSSLAQAVGTKAAPDFYSYWSGLGLGGTLVELGASLDLTKYYEQYGWDDRFTDAALSSVTQYGGHHGVPAVANTEAIVYNTELFDKAGINSIPTTYEELLDAAEKLKAAGITPIAFGGTVNWYVMRLLDNILETKCGAELNDALTGLRADWAEEPCVEESFAELKTWADKYFNEGWVSATDQQGQNVFIQGEAAMLLEGDWIGVTLDAAEFPADKLGVFAFPTGTSRIYGLQNATYVSASTEHPEEVARYLDWLTSPEIQTKYAASLSGGVPVVKGVEPADNGSGITDDFIAVTEAAAGQFQNNDQTLPSNVVTEYWRLMNGVATGSIPASEAGNLMQDFISNSTKK